MSPGRFLRTVRYLRWQQIIGRLRLLLPVAVPSAPASLSRRPWLGPWVAPARREASLESEEVFCFLGESHSLAAVGWDSPSLAKLWRYNQHYFDDFNASGAHLRRDWHHRLLARWIEENPAPVGSAWEPYPTSLRIVNWVKAAQDGMQLDAKALVSLGLQARWLERRLEHHLLGNHLFANGKALVFAGLFFEGSQADQWLARGLEIVAAELDEQILPDGGHFERSPMYHALALEDLLDLINLIRVAGGGAKAVEVASRAVQRVPAMLAWLRAMSHPNRELAHFNDSANGIAPSLDELEAYAARLGMAAAADAIPRSLWLRDSGYVRIERGPVVALLDLAPIGPDYLPGHAHADSLSFEVSLGTQRLIVNGGTSCYGEGERRQRERGTAQHSTVQVDGRDSSEVWAGFRVGRRAQVRDARVETGADAVLVSAWHDGYCHLRRAPRTWRHWEFHDNGLMVRDRVSPALPAVARYLLAPGLDLIRAGQREWRVAHADRVLARVVVEQGQAELQGSHYASRFGALQDVQCLAVGLENGEAATRWIWESHASAVLER